MEAQENKVNRTASFVNPLEIEIGEIPYKKLQAIPSERGAGKFSSSNKINKHIFCYIDIIKRRELRI